MIMSIAYGIDIKPLDGPYILVVEEAAECVSEVANAGSYLVDIIPICRSIAVSCSDRNAHSVLTVRFLPTWFPGAAFQRQARRWSVVTEQSRSLPYEAAQNRLVGSNP